MAIFAGRSTPANSHRLGRRSIPETGISDIEVDGHAMLLRGLNQVDNFTDNAQRAVREAKTEIDPI